MTASRRRLAIVAAIATVGVLAWLLRWQIGGGAFEIVEPAVRQWAANEVSRLSDSVYRLSVSTIRVAADQRRVAFDSLRLTTDTARNILRDRPYPTLDLRFHGCAVAGLDAERLAAGGGLRADAVACDSVVAAATVPPNVIRDTTGSGAFLTLRDSLRLPGTLPSIAFGVLQLPDVRLDLRIDHPSGDVSSLAFRRLAVQLDSVSYDPRVPARDRRTLLSRDAVVRLSQAEGSRGDDHLTLKGLRASLVEGTLELDDLAWTPVAGARADSLGVAGATVDTLALAGLDWGAALTRGDLILRSATTGGVHVTTARRRAATARTATGAEAPWTLDRFLAALHRRVVVDTFVARDIVVDHATGGARTTWRALHLTGLRTGTASLPNVAGSLGAGLRLEAGGLVHAWGDHRATVDTLSVDLPAGTLEARGIRHGTTGTDGQFASRRRWRSDRISLEVDRLRAVGLDGPAWSRTGAYRIRSLAVTGMALDVFSDKQLPSNPAPGTHRSPQGWLRTVPIAIRIDTASLRGTVTYRERGAESGMIGRLTFEEVRLGIANFATGSVGGGATRAIGVLATARLMGQAPFQLEATLPRTPGFDLTWAGRLGAMPASALNPMLVAVTDIALAKGQIEWIDFRAETHDGLSTGVVRPRYRDVEVSLPGVARSGALGGVRRAIAGMVANTFVVRGDNHEGTSQAPADGRIAHGWTPEETLIQHLWTALREGIGQVLTP